MHYFYVLYSLKDNRLYKGYSSDIATRFQKHMAGGNTSTKNRRPLVLIYLEQFDSKKEAMARERWSKLLEGGVELSGLLIEKGILSMDKKLKGSSASINRDIAS
ncbi:MAG: putative endonuclease [Saprospiraceae bacterium]|jgi:putative endonuclease